MVRGPAALAGDLDVNDQAALEAVVAVGAALRCALARAKRERRAAHNPLAITA